MNRTIKFRGKRVDTREWVFGSLVYVPKQRVDEWKNDTSGMPDKTTEHCLCQIYVPGELNRMCGLQQGKNGEPRKWKRDIIIYEVIPDTVGQFTGLRDKDDKELYQGDVFCLEHRNFVVIPCCGGLSVINTQYYFDKVGNELIAIPTNDVQSACISHAKIIGNIHDNPELLKD